MEDRKFQWDTEKEKTNITIHGLSFSTAVLIFNDPERIERYDENHSGLEDRYQTIGAADGVLFVVYTEWGETLRIISARAADKKERSIYYGNDSLYAEGWYKADS